MTLKLAKLILVISWIAATANTAAQAQSPDRVLEGAISGSVERGIQEAMHGMKNDSARNWGNMIKVLNGSGRWVWEGTKSRWVPDYSRLPHGEWSRASVSPLNPGDNLDVKIRYFEKRKGMPEIQFQIYASGYFRGNGDYRLYNHGRSLFSTAFKGSARIEIYLNVKAWLNHNYSRLDLVVESADIKYSNVVVDRVGHFGGMSARILFDTLKGAMDQWFPKHEREAIARVKRKINSLVHSASIRNSISRLIRRADENAAPRNSTRISWDLPAGGAVYLNVSSFPNDHRDGIPNRINLINESVTNSGSRWAELTPGQRYRITVVADDVRGQRGRWRATRVITKQGGRDPRPVSFSRSDFRRWRN